MPHVATRTQVSCRQMRKASARLLGVLLLNLNQKGEAERLLRESGDVGSGRVGARTTEATLLMQQGRHAIAWTDRNQQDDREILLR